MERGVINEKTKATPMADVSATYKQVNKMRQRNREDTANRVSKQPDALEKGPDIITPATECPKTSSYARNLDNSEEVGRC